MDITITQPGYKSIDELVWKDVPKFALITGYNGSGKTQLLEALNHKISNAQSRIPIDVSAPKPNADRTLYVRGEWNPGNAQTATFAQLQDYTSKVANAIKGNKTTNLPFISQSYLDKIRKDLNNRLGTPLEKIPESELMKELPVDLVSKFQPNFAEHLGFLFYNYHIRRAELILSGHNREGTRDILGPPPWEIFNEMLAYAGLSYRVNFPQDRSLREHYSAKLFTLDKDIEISFTDLSSGEKAIISLAFLLFSYGHRQYFPELLILDEPDVNLHPSLCDLFINIIHDLVVKKHGCRVIMTTHSPSTVALAPDDCIFEMRRDIEPRIIKREKYEAVRLLTSNLFELAPIRKFVLVEGNEDVQFYNLTFQILADDGHIDKSIQIIPISVRFRREKSETGGRRVVEGLSRTFRQTELASQVVGLVDRDVSPQEEPGVFQISRYSIENYLLDPIVVFAALIDNDAAAEWANEMGIVPGEEMKLRNADGMLLQSIADHVAKELQGQDSSSESTCTAIEYCNRRAIRFPDWIRNNQGHSLLSDFRNKFGPSITSKNLLHAYRKLRLIPTELRDLAQRIQNHTSS